MRIKTSNLTRLGLALALVIGSQVEPAKASVPPGRYVITNAGASNGTVFDTVTKLTWQQGWQTAQPSTAASICSNFNPGGTLTSGWRLPEVKELISIVDFESATSPMIDTAAFPGVDGTSTDDADFFWTATPSPAGNYYVVFSSGEIGTANSGGNQTSQGCAANNGCCGCWNNIAFRCVHS